MGGCTVEPEGEGLGSDREKALSLHPISEDFPIAKGVEAETQAAYYAFSDPAKSVTRRLVLDYMRSLIRAATVVKDSVRGDNVSAANVEEGAILLRRRERNGLKKLAGVVGGVLLGTGFSTLASMIQSNTFTSGGTILAVSSAAVGAFLVALNLSEGFLANWRRRRSPG
jgi:hypothetical protein